MQSSEESDICSDNENKKYSDCDVKQNEEDSKCYPSIEDTSYPLLCLPPDNPIFIDYFDEEEYEEDTDDIITKVTPWSDTLTIENGKKKRKKQLCVCLSYSRYEAVARATRRFGFREVNEEDDWNLMWSDGCVTLQKMMEMQKYQKINHFPGMIEICRKDLLSRNLNRMYKLFPSDYNFFPKSFHLPADYNEFTNHSKKRRKAYYILKPENGCQGRGIRLVKNHREVEADEHSLCQQYISKPYLIDGLKFDLRVYVLVTSCHPLRIYVFKDGLARFATAHYIHPSRQNLHNIYMHLTNYAINKWSNGYVADEQIGTKRRISTVNDYLKKQGYSTIKLWKEIDDIIIKTLVCIKSTLVRNHKSIFLKHGEMSACFEILGFDIILDSKLKAYLLEVNHSPSFSTDSALDIEIKDTLLYDTLNITNFHAVNRRKYQEEQKKKFVNRILNIKSSKVNKMTKEPSDLKKQNDLDLIEEYEMKHLGNFRCIYPPIIQDQIDYYEKFYNSQPLIYQSTRISKIREENARLSREKKEQDKNLENEKKPKNLNSILRPEGPTRTLIKKAQTLTGDTRLPTTIDESEEKNRLLLLQRRHAILRMYNVLPLVKIIVLHQPQSSRTLNSCSCAETILYSRSSLSIKKSNESSYNLMNLRTSSEFTQNYDNRDLFPKQSNYVLTAIKKCRQNLWHNI